MMDYFKYNREVIPIGSGLYYHSYANKLSFLDTKVPHIKPFVKLEVQKINTIVIQFTGYCEGKCQICYAKNAWKVKQCLTPTLFDEALSRIEHRLDNNYEVNIFGGEPVFYYDKFREFILHLNYLGKVPYIANSLFYDDKTFNRYLLDIINNKIQVKLGISLDPPTDNPRIYSRNYTKDTYSFLLKRIKVLHESGIQLGIRSTLSNKSWNLPRFFDDVCTIFNKTQHKEAPIYTIELSSYTKDVELSKYEKYLEFMENLYSTYTAWDWKNTPMIYPFSKLKKSKLGFFGIFKGCNCMTTGVTIQPNGVLGSCYDVVDLNDSTYVEINTPNDIITHSMNRHFQNKCGKCLLKAACGGICYRGGPIPDQRCHFKMWNFIQSLYTYARIFSPSTIIKDMEARKQWIPNYKEDPLKTNLGSSYTL